MSHDTPTIPALVRDRIGTRYARRLRSSGRLPAVIYGHKEDPVAITVDEKEVLRHIRHGSHLVNVAIDGGTTETCLVKELQFGYLGDNVIHIDFARVSLDEEVTVQVPARFVSEPQLKTGAVLMHNLTQLEVACRANNIPEEVVVDLSEMTDTFTVADLKLPPGVRTDLDPATVVAQITYVEEVETGEGAEVEAEGAEPEVITEAAEDEGGSEG